MKKRPVTTILILAILGIVWAVLATDAEKRELNRSVQEQIRVGRSLVGLVSAPYKRFAWNVLEDSFSGSYTRFRSHVSRLRIQVSGLIPEVSGPRPRVSRPRPQDLTGDCIQEKVVAHALSTGVDPSLALAVARVESNFNPRAVSSKGAIGVMQVMPATARGFGVSRSQLFDADTNIRVGLLYLKKMMNRFPEKELAIGAYNCGPGNIIRAGYRIPPFPETIDYVKKVKRAQARYMRMKTGPMRGV